jgi:DNA-binding HxlR family transcriptional regulator
MKKLSSINKSRGLKTISKTKTNLHKVCPVLKVAELLSDTWTMLIIRDLLAGNRRYSELEKSLQGISTRTLSLKLKGLIHQKLIGKDKDNLYSATEKGKGLRIVERAMRKYGERYL